VIGERSREEPGDTRKVIPHGDAGTTPHLIPRGVAVTFQSLRSTDPYFDDLCRAYQLMSEGIEEWRRKQPDAKQALEAMLRRRQGVLDTILMIFERSVANPSERYEEWLVQSALEAEEPTIHDLPLVGVGGAETIGAERFWNTVWRMSRRDLNIEVRANPRTMRRLIAGPEFMKQYPGAVTGRYAGELEEYIVQLRLSPNIRSRAIRVPGRA
jgi:hypothetical protein